MDLWRMPWECNLLLVFHCKWTVTFIPTNFWCAQYSPIVCVGGVSPVSLISVIHSPSKVSGNPLALWDSWFVTFFAVRLPDGGVTHSKAFSSLMGRAALSIWHRQSTIISCGRRNNLVNSVKKMCKIVAIAIGFFRKNFNFLKQRWVRLTSCAAKVHHISTIRTNSITK